MKKQLNQKLNNNISKNDNSLNDIENKLEQVKKSKKTEKKSLRRKWFEQMDVNMNDLLSFAECHKGARDVMGNKILFKFQSVLLRAYQDALT